jgi:L-threonylcarbamoyladenylate synthase
VIVPVGDDAFERCVASLRAGDVVAIPTDTVYGLAALPGDARAMRHLFDLKARSPQQSIAVLVADVDQAVALSAEPLDRVAGWWPGPLTAVVHRRADSSPLHLGGDERTVGLRCPDHDFVRRVAAAVGPIAATSANESGEPTAVTADEVVARFPQLGLVIDGGRLDGCASTVVDLTVHPPRVLRAGPIPAADLGIATA